MIRVVARLGVRISVSSSYVSARMHLFCWIDIVLRVLRVLRGHNTLHLPLPSLSLGQIELSLPSHSFLDSSRNGFFSFL